MRSLVILSLHIQLGLMEQLLFILPRKAFISSLITRSTAPIKSSSDVNSLANSCCFVHVTLIANRQPSLLLLRTYLYRNNLPKTRRTLRHF